MSFSWRGCGASGEGLKETVRLEACKQCWVWILGSVKQVCFLPN